MEEVVLREELEYLGEGAAGERQQTREGRLPNTVKRNECEVMLIETADG